MTNYKKELLLERKVMINTFSETTKYKLKKEPKQGKQKDK